MENETCKASNIRLCSPLTRPKRLPMKQPTRNMICHLKKAWSRAAVDGNKWYLYTCILYALYICIIYNKLYIQFYILYLCDSQSSGWRFSWPKGFQISEFSGIKIIINENRSNIRKCKCLLKKHKHKQALSFTWGWQYTAGTLGTGACHLRQTGTLATQSGQENMMSNLGMKLSFSLIIS